ncbi:MAG: iron ABC transporter permease [Burkholderiales bacterium]|nr:iron ABC transporter permease [Anaerolineae bacterium]
MIAQAQVARNTNRIFSSRLSLLPGLALGAVLLVLCLLWSITLGAADITPQVVYEALFDYDDTNFDHLVIQTARLPRVLAGALVGAALAVSGAVMQGLTRNPLADSVILGIDSGAAFVVVLLVVVTGNPPLSLYAIFAFIGAGIAAVLVYSLGSMGRGGATPLKLTLAGIILAAFISSFTTALLIHDQETLEKIRFWTVGSLAGREMPLLLETAPYMIVGLFGAVIISSQITTISLGEDVAKGLGQNTGWVKGIAAVIVVLLAGGAVALAGPVGFVGLVVPHIVRFLVGVDYRWVIPYSALLGAILLTAADVGSRVLIRPQELPVGIVMAFIGAPFFIALARWKVKR